MRWATTTTRITTIGRQPSRGATQPGCCWVPGNHSWRTTGDRQHQYRRQPRKTQQCKKVPRRPAKCLGRPAKPPVGRDQASDSEHGLPTGSPPRRQAQVAARPEAIMVDRGRNAFGQQDGITEGECPQRDRCGLIHWATAGPSQPLRPSRRLWRPCAISGEPRRLANVSPAIGFRSAEAYLASPG